MATDLLAEDYARTLRRFGIKPPVSTIYADAENLGAVFAENSFDYVTANNSLDHCSDPLKALKEMIRVVRPGCYVTVRHRENEARRTGYLGLHEWNFKLKNGYPILWRARQEIDIAAELSPSGRLEVIPEDRHVVFAVCKNAR